MTEKTSGPEQPGPDLREELLEALKVVTDPEIGISVVDLGLIYGIDLDEKGCRLRVTLTSPACPAGGAILGGIKRVAEEVTGKPVTVDLVWEPPWDPRVHATEDGKFLLGLL